MTSSTQGGGDTASGSLGSLITLLPTRLLLCVAHSQRNHDTYLPLTMRDVVLEPEAQTVNVAERSLGLSLRRGLSLGHAPRASFNITGTNQLLGRHSACKVALHTHAYLGYRCCPGGVQQGLYCVPPGPIEEG